MQAPSTDPLPWVTSLLRAARVFDTNDVTLPGDWYVGRDGLWQKHKDQEVARLTADAASALLDILTSAVAALHNDDRPYRVVLSAKNATASTALKERLVEVGSRPMNDLKMTEGQRAAVMLGLVLHEVGHICYAREYAAAVTRLFGKDASPIVRTLSNIAADLHDENAAMRVFPGLAPAVPVCLWWVGHKGGLNPDAPTIEKALVTSAVERVNAAIAATRYPWTRDWSHPSAQTWLGWWRDWAVRAENADRPKDHAEVVMEAYLKIKEARLPEPAPEPPTGCGGFPGIPQDPDDEPTQPGECKPGEDGEPKGKGKEPGPDGETPIEKPGDQPGGGNEPTDEPTDDEPGSGKGEGDEEGKGKEEGGDEPQPGQGEGGEQGPDGEGDEPSPEGEQEGKQPAHGQQGGGGGENPTYDPNEAAPGLDDPCPKEAGHEKGDVTLQNNVDRIQRGKREGMRSRVYHHASSRSGERGRKVTMIPRKGKTVNGKWVYEG